MRLSSYTTLLGFCGGGLMLIGALSVGALLIGAGGARGEVFVLTNNGRIRGELVNKDERPRRRWRRSPPRFRISTSLN